MKDAVRMKMVGLCGMLVMGFSLCGCASLSPGMDEVVVQTSRMVVVEDPARDKSGNFFTRRSLLCHQLFAAAVTNIAAQTGRSADSLKGATICGVDEQYADRVYSLRVEVVWSAARENAVRRLFSVTDADENMVYKPKTDEERDLDVWIGPKQVCDEDGIVHFLGFSAMAIGRNAVVSQQNMRRAELDAKAMAVRPFMGTDQKISDANVIFRPVLSRRSRHPLCPNRDMYVCGYEVISFEYPGR